MRSDWSERGLRPGENANVAALLGALAERFGTRAAFGDAGSCTSYADLAARAAGLGGHLARLIRPNERVGLLGAQGADWAAHFFAVLHAGGVAVLLDPELTDAELAGQIARSRVRLVLAADEHAPRAGRLGVECRAFGSLDSRVCSPPAHRGADDPAVIAFTSGTTGTAKGVRISHGNLRFQLAAFERVVPGRVRRTLSILPPHHLFGLTVDLLGTLAQGAHIHVCRSFLPSELARAMAAARPTHLIVVPAFLDALRGSIRRRIEARSAATGALFRMLFAAARPLPLAARRWLFRSVHRCLGGALKCVISGGAPLTAETERFFWRLGIRVLQGYGMTETSPAIAFNCARAHRLGSVGRPLPGVEVRIAPDGEIQTRGPHVMLGYDGDATCGATRWLGTGDTGHLDADGFVYVHGRANESIVLGNGKKVHPDDVEPALFTSPLIAEGAVIGLPGRSGPEVCAVVVPNAGLRHRPQAALLPLMQRTLGEAAGAVAPFKRPTRVVVCDHPLPRTSTRKVRRGALRATLTGNGGSSCPVH